MDDRAEWRRTLLIATLQLAVPQEMDRLRGLDPEFLAAMGREGGDLIAEHGDDLMFGGDYCAATFAALVRGLATAALISDGGVRWKSAGLHWCIVPGCDDPDADHPNPYPELAVPALKPKPRPVVDVYLPDEDEAA